MAPPSKGPGWDGVAHEPFKIPGLTVFVLLSSVAKARQAVIMTKPDAPIAHHAVLQTADTKRNALGLVLTS